MKTKSDKSLLLSTIVFAVIAIMLIFSMTLAWFTMHATSNVGGMQIRVEETLEIEYKLFYFIDSAKDGALSSELNIPSQGIGSSEGNYYPFPSSGLLAVGNPLVPSTVIGPGDKMTFALVLTNLSFDNDTSLTIEFYGIHSQDENGDPIAYVLNRVERAFKYSVKKVAYGTEFYEDWGTPIITSVPGYFMQANPFVLASNVDLTSAFDVSPSITIYFEIYFDEGVYGYDESTDTLVNNSNAFMNQSLIIDFIDIYE